MKLAKRIAKYKIYLDRSRGYAGYVQLLLLLKLTLSDMGINSLFVLGGGLAACIAIFLLIGYFDTRFGIRSRELENHSRQCPVTMEILNTVKEIKNGA